MSESILGLMFEIAANPDNAIAAMGELNAGAIAESGNLSSIWSGAMKAITGPTGIALGAIVGLGEGLLEAAKKASEYGNRIYEASEKTKMSAESLSGLMAISQETGTSFESLSSAFARGSMNIAKSADTGKGALTELFTEAQLQSLKLKSVDEQMQTVLHRIFALTDAGERNKELQALLGRGWQENVGVLKLLAEQGYAPAIEQAKKLNVFFDEKAAKEGHEYGIQMHQLTGEISGLGIAIGREVVPHVAEWLAQLHTVPYEAQLMGIGLEAQGLSLINFSTKVSAAVKFLRGDIIGAAKDVMNQGHIFDAQLEALAIKATDVFTAEHAALLKYKADIDSLSEGSEYNDPLATMGGGAKKGKGTGGEREWRTPYKDLLRYGPTLEQLGISVAKSIDGMNEAIDPGAVKSLNLWEGAIERAIDELPLAADRFNMFGSVLAPGAGNYGKVTTHSAISVAANAAKIAVDGLAVSMESAGGKSSGFSQKMMQAAQSIAEMAQKAQAAADQGETVDPKQQVAGMVQIAAAALLTYKERAVVESVYYAAKSVAAFAAQDYWAGAEYALASGLFAEAAGTSSKASSRGDGGGSSQNSETGHQGIDRGGGGGSNGGGKNGDGQTIVQIAGSLNTNGQQQLAAWVGMGSAVGLFKFNASGSSGIAASRY